MQKYIKKEMLKIINLTKDEKKTIYSGMLSNKEFDLALECKNTAMFMMDSELFALFYSWNNEKEKIDLEELKELIYLNHKK